MRQKSNGLVMILLILALGMAGFFGYKYFNPTPVTSPTPTANTNTVQTPIATSEISTGTVSGKLCYPSSFLPPGEIVAKNLDTKEIFTQSYPGSFDGGGPGYSFELPIGTYHLKYQAHASTKDTGIFTSGYYDECAKTMHTNECTPDSGHINIDVKVGANKETRNIDLCDFYYNPDQEKTLNLNF